MRARRFHRPLGSSRTWSCRHQLFPRRLVPLLCSRIRGTCGGPPRNRAPLGATLIAVSPQPPAKSSSLDSDSQAPFSILRDPDCEIVSRYRIAFTIPQQFRAAYRALGYPNAAKTRSQSWVLPIPASYVLDSTGLVVLSYLDADHTTRLEPAEIIVALTSLGSANIPHGNNR